MPCKVGILSGQEAFAERLIGAIDQAGGGEVQAEFGTVDALRLGAPVPYRVVIDRISHAVPFYREYTKCAALQGAVVINNPFRFFSDKAFGTELAARLGVAVPKTVTLPQQRYGADCDDGDLHNLVYPIDWEAVAEYVGFPAVLKPAAGYAWRQVHEVGSLAELLYYYNQSGEEVMMLQERIAFDCYVRVFVFGRKHALPVRYDPATRGYLVEHDFLSPALGERVVRESLLLSDVLDYDMNTCEWAISGGVPYAIDFINLVPDSKPESITPFYFERVLELLARTAVEYALDGRAASGFWCRAAPLSGWARGGVADPAPPHYGGPARETAPVTPRARASTAAGGAAGSSAAPSAPRQAVPRKPRAKKGAPPPAGA